MQTTVQKFNLGLAAFFAVAVVFLMSYAVLVVFAKTDSGAESDANQYSFVDSRPASANLQDSFSGEQPKTVNGSSVLAKTLGIWSFGRWLAVMAFLLMLSIALAAAMAGYSEKMVTRGTEMLAGMKSLLQKQKWKA